MNCNCNNKNNSMKEAKIKHVFGNVLRIAIPLTLRTVELVDVDVDGEIEQQAQVTDTDFIPSSDYPVNVVFNKGAVKVSLKAQMRDGNIAYVEDKGKISVGTYDITVTCNDNDGNPYRFKQNTILQVVDATADAGIATPIEYEVITWYLDAAIYLVMKGEDGVGIEDIITESSGEIGGVNTVTFVLTNGETRSFTILNGSGSVDFDFDENSLHPLSNSVITNKFKSIDANISGLFGDVDYDSSSKILRFWDITKSTILATIDARPFVKDGMVSNAYISNNTLVITFNTDSGKEAIGVPLTTVFNPNNYYTKTQVDSRIASAVANINLSNYYTKSQVDAKVDGKADITEVLTKTEHLGADGKLRSEYATQLVLYYMGEPYDEGITTPVQPYQPIFENGYISYAISGSTSRSLGQPQPHIVYCNAKTNKLYRWNGSEFVQVGGSNSEGGYEPPEGGIPKSDLAQSVQDTLDDVSNKVDKVAGKGLSTEDYTTAEKQKLAGLSNYDDTEIQAEVDAKYEKPSTGIPKTDLSSNVQASLGKADTALQSSDLEGYATTDDVDDAVAALVSSAPQTLDTLKELADALGDDPNFATTMATQLGNKVDKETGKGLSTNDYTTVEKTKLAGLENYDDSALQTAIDGKVDKESGKSLMTDAEHTKLAGIDPSTYATKTEVNAKQDKINDLASIRINSGKGVEDISSNADGTVVYTLANGDTYTLDLNHEHPQYVESDDLADVATTGSYDDLTDKPTIPAAYDDTTLSGRVSALENAGFITTETDPTVPSWAKQQTKPTYTAQEVGALPASTTIPTKVSDLTNDSGFTSNAGTITGITMNGASKGTSGVVDLGTVITAHQDISGKANASEMAVSTSGDQTTITLKTGTSATVINQHQSLSGRVQSSDVTNIVVCASESAYNSISPKDSNTLYLIKE